jgi:cysteinyl-tRNA synthetase
MRLYNTLTRREEEFKPIRPGEVRMYTCGPTLYNRIHIGNYRAFVFEDLLRRVLGWFGHRVVQVMNLTDVDDKIVRGCREANKPIDDFVEPFRVSFFDELKLLNIEPAEHYPWASRHVPEMVALILKLLDRGYAYRAEGSVYFRIDAFPGYGKLSHLDREGIRAGGSGRVAADEYEKEDVRDFALWKAWTPEDGAVFWETELGKGRPGWHIECSAMSMKYLGASFDIHTGGIDNIFPHHENEIAQSESATGAPFVNYWLHNAHLLVDGKKMAKSAGNFHTLDDLLRGGYDPLAIRHALISTHYRQPLNFTLEGLAASASALGRLRDFRERLRRAEGGSSGGGEAVCRGTESAFSEAIASDLNISKALAVVFDLVSAVHRGLDRSELGLEDARTIGVLIDRLDAVLGFFGKEEGLLLDSEVEALISRREAARKAKQYAEADRIRDQIKALGILLEDTPKGVLWKRLSVCSPSSSGASD